MVSKSDDPGGEAAQGESTGDERPQRKHAAPIAADDAGAPAQAVSAPVPKPDAQGLVSRIGTYAEKRKEAASLRQTLRATQRELDKLRSDLAHRRDIESNYDSIVSTQQEAYDKAQASRADSAQVEQRLEKELPAARDALEQMRRVHKEQLAPAQQAADAAKKAVREAEHEIARAQKERDAFSKEACAAQVRIDGGADPKRSGYDEALAKSEEKMAEVTEMHTRLGELRNEQGRAKSELSALQDAHRREEQPLYETLEKLQAELKTAQRNIKRQDKFAEDARAALDEANAVHDDPQATEDLAARVDALAEAVRQQSAQHENLKAEASAAAKKAHVGKLVAVAAFLLVAVLAVLLIVLFAGK